MKIINGVDISKSITDNLLIMDYALQFAEIREWNGEKLAKINAIRLYQRMYLPCKLVRLRGQKLIEYYQKSEAKSSIKWKWEWPDIPKPKGTKMKE